MTKLFGFLAVTGLMAATFTINVAQATPSAGAHGNVLAAGTMADAFKIHTKEPTRFTFQQVTIDPGGKTGWHTHPGKLLVVVAAGELTRSEADDCASHVYRTGDAFIEPGGDDVHEGRNLGTNPVILYVTYVIPVGRPLRLEADDPNCGF